MTSVNKVDDKMSVENLGACSSVTKNVGDKRTVFIGPIMPYVSILTIKIAVNYVFCRKKPKPTIAFTLKRFLNPKSPNL